MKASSKDIPKIVHYCWFGGGAKPRIVNRCMESWRKHMKDYVIMEWNEGNFDLDSSPYVQEAYKMKKFAFVSDYVRIHALYHYGGIYLDTDVEVLKPFDDMLHHASFWGFEQGDYIATSTIGAVQGHPLIHTYLESYRNKRFLNEDGSLNTLTNVASVTKLMQQYGLQRNGLRQDLQQLAAIYPQSFFSPYDYIHCTMLQTADTYAVHHFYKSWLPMRVRLKGAAKKAMSAMFGGGAVARLRRIRARL